MPDFQYKLILLHWTYRHSGSWLLLCILCLILTVKAARVMVDMSDTTYCVICQVCRSLRRSSELSLRPQSLHSIALTQCCTQQTESFVCQVCDLTHESIFGVTNWFRFPLLEDLTIVIVLARRSHTCSHCTWDGMMRRWWHPNASKDSMHGKDIESFCRDKELL